MSSTILLQAARDELGRIAAERCVWQTTISDAEESIRETETKRTRLRETQADALKEIHRLDEETARLRNLINALSLAGNAGAERVPDEAAIASFKKQTESTRERIKLSALKGPKNVAMISQELGISENHASGELSILVRKGVIARPAPGVYGPPQHSGEAANG